MENKTKIAVFLVGLSGGAGQVVLNYFSNMPDNYKLDVFTTRIESEGLLKKYKNANMKVYKITPKKESIFKNLYQMWKKMRSEKYDIAYAHMTLTNCFPLFIAWLLGVKVRISHYHLAPLKKKSFFETFLAWLTQIFSTESLACGEEAGKYLYGKRNFKIVRNAIDIEAYRRSEQERNYQRQNLGFPKDAFVLGHVGRFDLQKNHRFLIEVFKKFETNHKNSYLVLMGDGDLQSEIKNLIRSYKLDTKVKFLGQVKDVPRKMQALDMFILPSLYEGLSVSAIEAQAAGLFCVFSNTVSKETQIAENVEFLALEDGSNIWAKKISSIQNFQNQSNDNIKKLRYHGYDIKTEALKFDKYLQNLVQGN